MNELPGPVTNGTQVDLQNEAGAADKTNSKSAFTKSISNGVGIFLLVVKGASRNIFASTLQSIKDVLKVGKKPGSAQPRYVY